MTHILHSMPTALRLARQGQGKVEPNPMVGAVLVRDGRMVASGWHEEYGGPHAEIACLNDARTKGVDPAGCDMYVTLEPCGHRGKTGPCTKALIAAGIRRVIVAMEDPFPQVAGRGIAQLRAAGIEVEVGCQEEDACELNAPYLKRLDKGLPWTIAKWAQTLDGRVATATGHSQWISSPASRQHVHELRARVDAVMVGIGTVLADDPQLTARDVELKRTARRVIVDPQLKIPLDAKLLQGGNVDPPLTIAVKKSTLDNRQDKRAELEQRGVEIIALENTAEDDKALALTPLLEHLVRNHDATNVLIEGGPVLLGHLFSQGLVDQVLAFIAPKLLGNATARAAVEGLPLRDTIDQAIKLSRIQFGPVGDDVLLDFRVDKEGD